MTPCRAAAILSDMATDSGERTNGSGNTRFVESARGQGQTSSLGLPPEMLAKARARLRRFALLMCCFGLVGTSLLISVHWLMSVPSQGKFIYIFQIMSTLLAILLYLAARSDRLGHTTVLHLGLGYEVLACLLISIGVPYHFLASHSGFPHLTFVSVLIVLYPLIVPSRPRLTLIVSLVCAGTVPLGVWVVGLLISKAMPA